MRGNAGRLGVLSSELGVRNSEPEFETQRRRGTERNGRRRRVGTTRVPSPLSFSPSSLCLCVSVFQFLRHPQRTARDRADAPSRREKNSSAAARHAVGHLVFRTRTRTELPTVERIKRNRGAATDWTRPFVLCKTARRHSKLRLGRASELRLRSSARRTFSPVRRGAEVAIGSAAWTRVDRRP